MADMDSTVTFSFVVTDGVTPVAERMAGAQDQAAQATERTNQSIDSQNIKFIAQLAAVSGAYAGLRRMTNGLHELGMISDADAKSLNKMVSVIGVVSGAFMTIKSAIKIMESLRSIELGVAAVETYRAVLKNPAAVAAVGIGLAAAGAVGGYALGGGFGGKSSSGGGSVNQTVNINGLQPTDSRAYQREMFEAMGG